MDRLLSSSKDRSLSESDSAPGVGNRGAWPWPQDMGASGARKEPAADGLGVLTAGGLDSDLGGVCPLQSAVAPTWGTGKGNRGEASSLPGPGPHLRQHLDETWPRLGQWDQHEPGGCGLCGQQLSHVEPGHCP